jgi:hypothetical protein
VLRFLKQPDARVGLDQIETLLDELSVRLRPVLRDVGDGCRTVPGEPRGVFLPRSSLPCQDDFERTLPQVQRGQVVTRVDELFAGQAVKAIDLPIQLLLLGDHEAADPIVVPMSLFKQDSIRNRIANDLIRRTSAELLR